MQDEPLIEAADGCPRARVGQHQMRPDDRLGERLLKHVLLEGHVVDVGDPAKRPGKREGEFGAVGRERKTARKARSSGRKVQVASQARPVGLPV